MGILVSSTDFTGYYKLPINTRNTSELNEVISLKERLYLNKVLGVDLAQLFIDDLNKSGSSHADLFGYLQRDSNRLPKFRNSKQRNERND